MSSRCCRVRYELASTVSFSHGSFIPGPSSKSIPDATHSKTLRSDSPAPIGLSDVPIAFSTSSSRGHPESGVQVGTRLHKSLMIRITRTAELRLLTLAWRHKQKPVESEALTPRMPPPPCAPRLHETSPENKAQTGQNSSTVSKSTTVQTDMSTRLCPHVPFVVDKQLRELSMTRGHFDKSNHMLASIPMIYPNVSLVWISRSLFMRKTETSD